MSWKVCEGMERGWEFYYYQEAKGIKMTVSINSGDKKEEEAGGGDFGEHTMMDGPREFLKNLCTFSPLIS